MITRWCVLYTPSCYYELRKAWYIGLVYHVYVCLLVSREQFIDSGAYIIIIQRFHVAFEPIPHIEGYLIHILQLHLKCVR